MDSIFMEWSDDTQSYRDAKEVFLFMDRNVRVSRNIRARWFFEHLDQLIKLDDFNKSARKGEHDDQSITVVGMIPKNGPDLMKGEKLRLVSNSVVYYFSKLYRLIFVMDFSPSSFVSDDSGCVLCKFQYLKNNDLDTRLIHSVEKCIRNLLLQGILLNESNVEEVIQCLRRKIKLFIDNLCKFAQPHMKEWNIRRRELRRKNEELSYLFKQNHFSTNDITNVSNNTSSSNNLLAKISFNNDQGFIQPDWALIFMLRLGLMGVLMLPENTQANIIIITDGVCGIPDSQALQSVLAQLRFFTVSCSFIQVNTITILIVLASFFNL